LGNTNVKCLDNVDFSCSSDCSLIELVLVAVYSTKEGTEIVVKTKEASLDSDHKLLIKLQKKYKHLRYVIR